MEMTLYLIDANVLIRAKEDYYPLDRIPQFWQWLIQQGIAGVIKIPWEIYNEITNGEDNLAKWVRQKDVKNALLLDENLKSNLLHNVLNRGYRVKSTVKDLKKIGRDPFLIAYACVNKAQRVVVTKEVSKPSRKGSNHKIPDVCANLGVKCIDDFELYRKLNFTI